MQAPHHLRPAFPVQIACVLIITLAVVWWAQRPAAGMYEYDSRYHIRYSEILRHDLAEGRGLPHRFPWWQETFLAEHWADKDFLYHLLLIPFTFGDLESGGKKASLVFATALYLCVFLALRWVRAPAAAAWTVALLVSSTSLLYRAGIVRSHVLAIAIALLGTAAILRGSRAGVFLTSAVYALTHIAWHLLPGIALVHVLTARRGERRVRWWLAGLSLAGTGLAVVISPYFPDNLRLWWVQNVTVPAMAWTGGVPHLQLGVEMMPGSPIDLVFYNPGPVLFTLAGIALWLAPSHDARDAGGSTTSGAVTLVFLLLTLASRRFVEFWAPFSVLFAATAAGRFLAESEARRPQMPRTSRMPRGAQVAAAVTCSALLLTGAGALSMTQARRLISLDPGRTFTGCSSWIRDHVPAGETVFTASWDEFPELFFTAPGQHYLVGLDPTFMVVTDPARFRLWREIVLGLVADIHEPIQRTFHCRYLFAGETDAGFLERADYDPWLRLEARDPECGVYSLLPEPSGSGVSEWKGEGGVPVEVGSRGFVDVAALSGSTATAGARDTECAVVRARLEVPPDSPRRGSLKMGISTDDAVKVQVNGTLAFDSAASVPSLEEALHDGRERVFVADVMPGYNDVAVTTCRSGGQWGFFLRFPVRP